MTNVILPNVIIPCAYPVSINSNENNEYVYVYPNSINNIPNTIAIPVINVHEDDRILRENNRIINVREDIRFNVYFSNINSIKTIEILFLISSLIVDIFTIVFNSYYHNICIIDIISISNILIIYLIKYFLINRIGFILTSILYSSYIAKLILYPSLMSYYLWHNVHYDHDNYVIFIILSLNIGIHIYIQFLGIIYIILLY